jgi:hypothetical protein
MRASVRCAGVVLAGLTLLALPSCQPVNIEKTLSVSAGDSKFLDIDAPRAEQKVKVTVSAPAPVSAYLVLEKNKKAVENALLGKKLPLELLLGSEEDKEKIDFDATVPAKEPYSLYVTTKSTKSIEAKVKVVGR